MKDITYECVLLDCKLCHDALLKTRPRVRLGVGTGLGDVGHEVVRNARRVLACLRVWSSGFRV